MAGSLGENYFQEVLAVRKGRGHRQGRQQSLCELKVGITDERQVVLRTLDDSGIAPIVALLDRGFVPSSKTGSATFFDALILTVELGFCFDNSQSIESGTLPSRCPIPPTTDKTAFCPSLRTVAPVSEKIWLSPTEKDSSLMGPEF